MNCKHRPNHGFKEPCNRPHEACRREASGPATVRQCRSVAQPDVREHSCALRARDIVQRKKGTAAVAAIIVGTIATIDAIVVIAASVAIVAAIAALVATAVVGIVVAASNVAQAVPLARLQPQSKWALLWRRASSKHTLASAVMHGMGNHTHLQNMRSTMASKLP